MTTPIPLSIAILTISDTRTPETDISGQYLSTAISSAGHTLQAYQIIQDDKESIKQQLQFLSKRPDIDVVITTGGTGITARDVTPEAVHEVVEMDIPGFGELFRWISFQTIGTSTIQSRACAGVLSGTLIFALPGSTNACKDAWTKILVEQLDINHKPCNFVQLLPRLANSKRKA